MKIVFTNSSLVFATKKELQYRTVSLQKKQIDLNTGIDSGPSTEHENWNRMVSTEFVPITDNFIIIDNLSIQKVSICYYNNEKAFLGRSCEINNDWVAIDNGKQFEVFSSENYKKSSDFVSKSELQEKAKYYKLVTAFADSTATMKVAEGRTLSS